MSQSRHAPAIAERHSHRSIRQGIVMQEAMWMRDLRVLRASVEMFGIGSIVAVAIAYLFPALASAGPLGPVTQSVSRTATSNQMAPDLHKTWRKSMSRKLSLEMGGPIGCFHAKYPNSEWQTVPCGKARQGRHIPARGTHHPQIVGDAED